ncbi:DNA topoisomerase IB [Microcoleus sp. FACHB-1515]|uniref:DNA topoisomerase IB n=1 Tax=Cyanophyceae TaxID=3028117 RepID=UPI00168216E0|nr:DNA topoisomerase IB [Microcoleus sp. FACHB-1515]MBD2091788.1 DNA topoisomerase IB [Microcoleus sp. FACHB-1515]
MSPAQQDRALRQHIKAITSTKPVAAASAVGLRYVSDDAPGITRKRSRRAEANSRQDDSFVYTDANGRRVRDRQTLERIRALGIPPAWEQVWICPIENGHLQATGRDAKGRKQYRYHALWRQIRDQTKFTKMIAFSETLPKLRQQINHDLALPGLPKQKVLATVLRLMELTRIRVGNEEYAKTNNSFGLTTMQDEHVDISGSTVRFQFRGKSGVEHDIEVRDRRLANIIKRCRDIAGQELFQYIDDNGDRQSIDSGDVNEYLKEVTGQDFTAKDFRTWAGTVLAARELHGLGECSSQTEAKKALVQAIKTVSQHLGNRPATCRKYYVHPTILDCYLDGSLCQIVQQHLDQELAIDPHGLRQEELAVVMLLKQQLLQELQQQVAS